MRVIARTISFVGMCLLSFIGADEAIAATDRVHTTLTRQLIQGMEAAPIGSLPAASGYGAPSLAIQTIAENGQEDRAADHTRQMLAALGQQARGRFRFVALGSLDKLILAIKAQGLPRDEEQLRIQELRVNARADVFVHGTLTDRDGRTYLSYQAVNTATGELLAATESVAVSGPRTIQVRTPAARVSPDPQLPYRASVAEAEQLLFDKGYDPGPVDGFLTPETREAIRTYQLDSALPVNGRLTRRVVSNLRRDTRTTY